MIVDDGSTDETAEVLERERERGELDLRLISRAENGGLAVARQEGWRAARADLLAFTDDDCVPGPGWLAAGLAAARAQPGRDRPGTHGPEACGPGAPRPR